MTAATSRCFRSRRLETRSVASCSELVNVIPRWPGSADQSFPTTATNGDWERYRGVADFLSSEDFAPASISKQAAVYGAIAPSL